MIKSSWITTPELSARSIARAAPFAPDCEIKTGFNTREKKATEALPNRVFFSNPAGVLIMLFRKTLKFETKAEKATVFKTAPKENCSPPKISIMFELKAAMPKQIGKRRTITQLKHLSIYDSYRFLSLEIICSRRGFTAFIMGVVQEEIKAASVVALT